MNNSVLMGEISATNSLDGEINNGIEKVFPPLIDLEVTPSIERQTFNHSGSYGYDEVVVNAIDIQLQDKTATPTTSNQTITADEGYTALGEVTVSGVTSSIDNNIVPENIISGKSILGVNGNVTGDSFYNNIQVGDNLRNKKIYLDENVQLLDTTFYRKFILLNNTTEEEADNDAGDFIAKSYKDIFVGLYDSADVEEFFIYENVKARLCYIMPNDKDYIVTHIDTELTNDFKVGYKAIEDFEFEKVNENNITSGVTINGVVGNAPDNFDKFLQGTLAVGDKYENPKITRLPNGMFSGSSFDSFTNVISFPNLTTMGYSTFYPASNITGLELPKLMSNTAASYIIMNCTKLKYIFAPDWSVTCSGPMRGNILCETIDFRTFPSGREIGSYAFQNLTSLTKMIIRGTTLIPMTSTSNNLYGSPLFTGSGCLYVRPTLVDTYKSATNWSAMASRIYPYYLATSEADITTKLNDNSIPVGSLIIYNDGEYTTNRYTVKTSITQISDLDVGRG